MFNRYNIHIAHKRKECNSLYNYTILVPLIVLLTVFFHFDRNQDYDIISIKAPYIMTFLVLSLVTIKGISELSLIGLLYDVDILMHKCGMSSIPHYIIGLHKSRF